MGSMNTWTTIGYFAFALVLSTFYGARGQAMIAAAYERTEGSQSGAHRRFRRLDFWHQAWFNFAGSAMGWGVGYWVFRRVAASNDPQHSVGVVELFLLLIAALGIVGYLPQTLNAIPGLLSYLSQLATKKFEESTGKAKAAGE
jgi:hypothetical protein